MIVFICVFGQFVFVVVFYLKFKCVVVVFMVGIVVEWYEFFFYVIVVSLVFGMYFFFVMGLLFDGIIVVFVIYVIGFIV